MQVRVQKKYFFEFKFKFGKMIEFFRVRVQVRVRSPAFTSKPLYRAEQRYFLFVVPSKRCLNHNKIVWFTTFNDGLVIS